MDRNTAIDSSFAECGRRPSRRGVDRNIVRNADKKALEGRPSRRGVDRNLMPSAKALDESVAPHAGAWIETRARSSPTAASASPLTQGRGSKRQPEHEPAIRLCRPSRRGVDRNSHDEVCDVPRTVAPHAGAWIETGTRPEADRSGAGRPSRRGVDRNVQLHLGPDLGMVAPHAGAWIETGR